MPPLIYLVRHAESKHNISKDFSHRDPPLTATGHLQASALADTFPDPGSIGIVVTSPLRRTLQTTLLAFSHILSEQYVMNSGKSQGSRLIIDPDLQERSDHPCDTGSEQSRLEKVFPALDFSVLGDDWFAKEGIYASDDAAVVARAKRFRERLRDVAEDLQKSEDFANGRKNIVVVTHGVFMKYLCEDMTIDLPKAGWKAFMIANGADGEAVLGPAE